MAKDSPIRCFDGSAEPFQPFWQWKVEDAAQPAELSFYGVISEYSWLNDTITPAKFKQDLQNYGKNGPITIRMHSPGGEIFAAHAIASTLRDYPGKKTVVIDGICASAAVMVALSADKIQIQDAAYMMVHNPGFGALGGWLDAETLRKAADMLDIFTTGMLDAYQNRTSLTRDELQSMLDAETWMTANQAVANGFADEVLTGKKMPDQARSAVKNALIKYVNVPGELLNISSDGEQIAAGLESEREAQSLRDYIDLYLRR